MTSFEKKVTTEMILFFNKVKFSFGAGNFRSRKIAAGSLKARYIYHLVTPGFNRVMDLKKLDEFMAIRPTRR